MKGYTTVGVAFMCYLFLLQVLVKEDWIMVFINGVQKEGYAGKPLPDVLAGEKYDVKRIAVEINGEIISKSLFAETTVEDGDRLEVVSFVGGG